MIGPALLDDGIEAKAGGAHEHAEVILHAAVCWGDEVGEGEVRLARDVLLRLLPEGVKGVGDLTSGRVVRVDHNVVANAVGGVYPNDADQLERLVFPELGEHLLGVVEELLGLFPDRLVIEDLRVAAVRVAAAQLPNLEEGIPIDCLDHIHHVEVVDDLGANEIGHYRGVLRLGEVKHESLLPGLFKAQVLPVLQVGVELFPQLVVLLPDLLSKVLGRLLVHEFLAHRHAPAGIEDIDHCGIGVVRGDLHSSVHLAGGGTTNEQGDLEASLLHLNAHGDHLVQGWGDQTAQPNDVGIVLFSRIKNRLVWNHHAQVDHLEVVAAQHHTNDVLANVVHISLHGGHNDNTCMACLRLNI
mmetsp:Transcript_14897/g.37862  ORF Transcript_14897/g.37862 Transcript_14897/m.37862 type:complete len:356 (-) Transcript_14897:2109-3176(-)